MANTNPTTALAPLQQEVTSLEILQSGGQSTGNLTESQRKKISDFVSAHHLVKQDDAKASTPNASNGKSSSEAKVGVVAPIVQVNEVEQSQAVLTRGQRSRTTNQFGRVRSGSKFESLYKLAISDDEYFLRRDLSIFKISLSTRERDLVDLSSSLNSSEKAFRKFLLISMLEERGGLTRSELRHLNSIKQPLLEVHGDYINDKIEQIELAQHPISGLISFRENARAYSVEDIGKKSGHGFNGLLYMFQKLQAISSESNFLDVVADRSADLHMILEREKVSSPAQVLKIRRHQMLAEVRYLKLMMLAFRLHTDFLRQCEKFSMSGLPSTLPLMEITFKIVASLDVSSGVREAVNSAASVKGAHTYSSNQMVANYARWILGHPIFEKYYASRAHKLSVVDAINKAMLAGAICAHKVAEYA